MRWRRVAAPLGGVLLALALYPGTRGLDEIAGPGQLGPGFWPRLALIGLGVACAAKAVQEWRRLRLGRTWPTASGAPPERPPISPAALAAGIAVIVAYVLLTPAVGFAVATAAFIVAFMLLCGARSPATLAATSVLGTVSLLYLFIKLVYLPLPKGMGPFEPLTLAVYRALRIF